MGTIPTLLAAAVIAVGTTVLTVPQAHAACTMEQLLDPAMINICMPGSGSAPAAKPAPQAPAPQALPAPPPPVADHPLPPPPGTGPPPAAPAPGMSPGPESSWPGGVAADCANPAYASHYNFFCADVGIPTPAGAPAPAAPPAAPPQVAQNIPGAPGVAPVAAWPEGATNPETGGPCNYGQAHTNGTLCSLAPGTGDGTWTGTNDDCLTSVDGDNCIPKNKPAPNNGGVVG